MDANKTALKSILPVTVYLLSENDNLVEVESSESDQITADILSKHSIPIKTRLKNLARTVQAADEDDFEGSSEEEENCITITDVSLNGSADENVRVRDLTMKYINGDLNFSEYSALVDFDNQLEGEDDLELGQLSKKDQLPLVEKTTKSRSTGKRKSKLPPALLGLMGEANLTFARGDSESAIKICMEVIKEVPFAPEPYQSLGMIYEELGQTDKSMQFQLIAAHLSPSDAEEWTRLGEMLVEQEDLQQAITCYSKAIRANPYKIGLHLELCRLLEQAGQKKYALRMYLRAFKYLDADQGTEAFTVAKYIAKMYHENNEIGKAIEAMDLAFTQYPGFVTSEDVNLMLELMLSNKEHAGCVMVLCEYCGVSVLPSLPPSTAVTSNSTVVARYSNHTNEEIKAWVQTCSDLLIPDSLSIDLQIKLVISLIYLNATHILDKLLQSLKLSDPDETGDLYLDIAEAYMATELHREAIPFLETLVLSKSYNLPAVWLQLAECLRVTHQYEGALDAYGCVIKMAPHHSEARLALSDVYMEMGQNEKALQCLIQDDPSQPLDTVVLHHHCQMLFNNDRIDDFIHAATLALYRHCPPAKAWSDPNNLEKTYKEINSDFLKSQIGSDRQYVHSVPMKEEYDLFMRLCLVLFEKGRFEDLQKITSSAVHSKVLWSECRVRNSIPYTIAVQKRMGDLDVMAVYAAYFNKDYGTAFNLVRDFVARNTESVPLLNMLALIIQRSDDMRYQRFLVRLQGHHLNRHGITILNANCSFINGSYKYAMADYMAAHKSEPDSPFLSFMLGVLFLHISCHRRNERRHSLVVQAFAFFDKYVQLRGECQESLYNLGRACHQLDLLYLALNYYKKALACEPPDDDLDLTREIAYNIANIYRNSGASHLAVFYIKKYIVI